MAADEQRIARALACLDAAVTRLERAALPTGRAAPKADMETTPDGMASPSASEPLEQRHQQAARGLDATIGRLRTLLDGIEGG